MTEIYLHIVARRATRLLKGRDIRRKIPQVLRCTMRVQLIGHFQPCMTEIYLHIDARMANYMDTHP